MDKGIEEIRKEHNRKQFELFEKYLEEIKNQERKSYIRASICFWLSQALLIYVLINC